MPCGCEGDADNADLCRYPALRLAAQKGASVLRDLVYDRMTGKNTVHWDDVEAAMRDLEQLAYR